MAAMGLGRIYTFGPTFRAEHSNTTRHAAEFWQIEPEVCFADINLPMDHIISDHMLADQLLPRIPENPQSVCCTIQLSGTRCFEPNLAALEQSLRPVFFHISLIDHSIALSDLFRYENEDSLSGYVTRDLKQQISRASTEEEHAKCTLALEFALAALEGRDLAEGGL